MANMLDYIRWRGDISFSEREVNEVDSLVFSTLAYFYMDGYVTAEPAPQLTLAALLEAYEAAPNDQSMTSTDTIPLLRAAAGCDRFRSVGVGAYVTDVDAERGIQFCAVSFCLDGGSVFVAYRGTDRTIVGWREDCELSYMSETAGQSAARDYLDMIGSSTDAPLYVGGHSKGGNFAVYAASFCRREVQDRIVRIFSNDGPGFNDEVSARPGYTAAAGRISKFIPDSSLVGTLLTALEKPVIIKSSLRGPVQHEPYSWQIERDSFVRVDSRSSGGSVYDKTLTAWLETFDCAERERFVTALFDILEDSGMITLNELSEKKWESYNAILKAIKHVSPEGYRDITSGLRKFAVAGRGAVWNEAKLTFEKKETKKKKK